MRSLPAFALFVYARYYWQLVYQPHAILIKYFLTINFSNLRRIKTIKSRAPGNGLFAEMQKQQQWFRMVNRQGVIQGTVN
jgi:hypothetical protein